MNNAASWMAEVVEAAEYCRMVRANAEELGTDYAVAIDYELNRIAGEHGAMAALELASLITARTVNENGL